MHADDTLLWVTDLGWIMGPWELVGGLAAGGTVVLVEGVPDYPAPDRLWSIVERQQVTILGVSPTLVRALMKHGDEPVRSHDLSSLRILASTGEPWDPESWRWLFEHAGGGPLSDHQHFGRHGGRRLPAVGPADHSAQAVLAGRARAGDGRRRLRRRGQAAPRGASASSSAPSPGRR